MSAIFKNISLYWKCQVIGWGLHCLYVYISTVSYGFDNTAAWVMIVTTTTGLTLSHLMRTVLVKLKVTQKSVRLQVIYFLCITLIFSAIESVAWGGRPNFGVVILEGFIKGFLYSLPGTFFFFLTIMLIMFVNRTRQRKKIQIKYFF